jgi:hypothetical protein
VNQRQTVLWAALDPSGSRIEFAVFAEHAVSVELQLRDVAGALIRSLFGTRRRELEGLAAEWHAALLAKGWTDVDISDIHW